MRDYSFPIIEKIDENKSLTEYKYNQSSIVQTTLTTITIYLHIHITAE